MLTILDLTTSKLKILASVFEKMLRNVPKPHPNVTVIVMILIKFNSLK